MTPEQIWEGTKQVWKYLKGYQLHMEIQQAALSEIETLRKREDFQGIET